VLSCHPRCGDPVNKHWHCIKTSAPLIPDGAGRTYPDAGPENFPFASQQQIAELLIANNNDI